MNLLEWLGTWRGVLSVAWMFLLLTWEGIRPFFELFPGGWRARVRHAGWNVLVGFINAALVAVVFVFAWRWLAVWAERQHFGLLNWLPLDRAGHFILAVLLFDLWTYSWHWSAHRLAFLWHVHQFHHLDDTMDVTTANRFHPLEITISSLLRCLLIPLLGIRFEELVVYETLLQFVVQWQHANVGLPRWMEKILSEVLVTPGLHKVHHSRVPSETHSNFSSLLSVWDRVFGTRVDRPDPQNIRFGLESVREG